MTTLRRIIVGLALLTAMSTLFIPSKPAQAAAICFSVFINSSVSVTGAWSNNDLATRGITRLGIDCTPDGSGGEVWTMHVFGKCHPTDCDWGVVRATPVVGASYISAFYNQGFAWRYIYAFRLDQYTIQVRLSTTFTDFKRPHYTWDGYFSRLIDGLGGNCPNPTGDLSNGC